jgi:hypothetical protein
MPKKQQGEFTTSNVGRQKPWTPQQNEAIEAALPRWHNFSLVEHKDLAGRNVKLLTDWKKAEADMILSTPAFSDLPLGVSLIFH